MNVHALNPFRFQLAPHGTRYSRVDLSSTCPWLVPTWKRFCSLSLPAAVLFLAGCTSTNLDMIAADKRQPPVELGVGANDGDLATQLHTVIYYGGPGAWKTDAEWDEYAISVKNVSIVPVVLTAVSLIDPLGNRIHSSSDPWGLIKQTASLAGTYKEAGILYSKTVDPNFLTTAAAVGVDASIYVGAAVATEALWVAAVGGSALAATAIIALPVVAVVAIPVILVSNGNKKRAIENEFGKRLLDLPQTIQPGETLTGSVFFPIVPSPAAVQICHAASGVLPTEAPTELLLGQGCFDRLHVSFDP